MKILFLDIDGVLNSAQWIQNVVCSKQDRIKEMKCKFGSSPEPDIEYYAADIDPSALNKLKCIFEYHVDAKIVISSSWRHLMNVKELITIFKYLGWPNAPIIDQTPCLQRMDIDPEGKIPVLRGHEVRAWLEMAGERFIKDKRIIQPASFKYAILDDDSDFLEGQPLIQTSWETGLLDEHIDRVIVELSK
jgi:hypothetical protein